MRALAQPEVLRSASIAASLTAIACYPRLSTAPDARYPTWYLEALVFLGSIVLWGFVFAWHTRYSHRPVITWKLEPAPLALATVAGIVLGILWHFGLDPALRVKLPGEYPATSSQWLAHTLFVLSFQQLFLVFAPLAWLWRLFRRQEPAVWLTVLFGLAVLWVRNRSSPVPPPLFAWLAALRVLGGFVSVYLFLRGGLVLVWWANLLVASRHLLFLVGGA